MNSGQAITYAVKKEGGRVVFEDFPLMAPVFSVCQPILEVIISVKSFVALGYAVTGLI